MKLVELAIRMCAICTGIEAGTITKRDDIEGYYWRDYNQEVPIDAIKGGSDKEGKPTYVGQVIHNSGNGPVMQPGQIDAMFNNISYVWGGEAHTATKFVKILCTSKSDRLKWIETNVTDIRFLLPQKYFIVAGYTDDYPYLVGRTRRGDQVIVGKVAAHLEAEGIDFVEDGAAVHEISYEVLAFSDE